MPMRRSVCLLLCLVVLSLPLAGCYTLKHTVGEGGSGAKVAEARQWFILWGLVPLNEHDGGHLADGATDYTVQTQMSPLDVIMNLFTGWITVYSRTVTVTK
jgi:hypothetical protein